jgi:hypothetical protein
MVDVKKEETHISESQRGAYTERSKKGTMIQNKSKILSKSLKIFSGYISICCSAQFEAADVLQLPGSLH